MVSAMSGKTSSDTVSALDLAQHRGVRRMKPVKKASTPSFSIDLEKTKEALGKEVNKKADVFVKLGFPAKHAFKLRREEESNFPKGPLQKALYCAYLDYVAAEKYRNLDHSEEQIVLGAIRELVKVVMGIQKEAPLGYPKRKIITEFRLIENIEWGELELVKLKKTISQNKIPYLSKLPSDQLWRLFIDSDFKPSHPYEFDCSDFGYLSGVFSGFNFALNFKHPLTVEFILSLHEKISVDVSSEKIYPRDIYTKINAVRRNLKIPIEQRQKQVFDLLIEAEKRTRMNIPMESTGTFICKMQTGFRTERHGFMIGPSNSTPEGVAELREKLKEGASRHIPYAKLTPSFQPDFFEYEIVCSGDDKYRFVTCLTTRFNQDMSGTKDPDKKLRLIVQFVQDLDQFHAFEDGNIRLCACILMNMLLIRESLCPVIWLNPNVIDASSLDQCCVYVKEGQDRFRQLLLLVDTARLP